ncbi:MAG: class I SAM-dependent methyltransferase [Deltaproteobacteria bacterium]|nr:class I SAM-dependent methyltransferase [Deltaproteobacteria bacterium]
MPHLRMYSELAHWWPLLSPPAHYVEEAAYFRALLRRHRPRPRTLLELGCGGGSLASNLKRDFALTLTDVSPQMLAVCRAENPECEVLEGDMRTLRLAREFDAVLVHDAIMYATTEADLRATIATAALHCRAGGLVLLAPDCTRESFGQHTADEDAGASHADGGTDHGGEDAPDGRGLRYLEWCWDSDPSDTTYQVAYAFTLRERDGSVRTELDVQTQGLFSEATWLALMRECGLEARTVSDPWRGKIFAGVRRAAT